MGPNRGLSARASRVAALAALALALDAGGLGAQGRLGGVFVNSEAENYLRDLQVAGAVPLYPWSIRGFSPREQDRLAPPEGVHPWAARFPHDSVRPSLEELAPELRVTMNSAFPYGSNDGAVWAGRGITGAVRAGLRARRGAFSLTLAPEAFWTQNSSFPLLKVPARPGQLIYADPRSLDIDLPQRPGDGGYGRLDPGQSTARMDTRAVTLGVSTANQHWGPASEYPVLLGNNAGGFPHVFLGTGVPAPVGVGRLHARLVWGELAQSEYSPITGTRSRRLMSGAVVSFTPRWLPGLEVGGATFIHTPWPEDGLEASDFFRVFQGLKDTGESREPGGPGLGADNQIATVFGRWVFPRSGLEVYGEFGREDQVYDLRNLAVEPDHDAAYMFGMRKVWLRSPARMVVMRGEILSTQVSHLDLIDRRTRFYTHFAERQGHTQRGQILGSPAGYGGAGALLAGDWYHPRGRWTVTLARELRRDRADYPVASVGTGGPDVMNALGVEMVRFTRTMDVTAGLRGVYELNRDFGGNAFNLNATIGLRASL